MGLQFDPDSHTYRVGGVVVPNVTSILEGVGISDYSRLAWDVRDRALRRGIAVHEATRYDDENDLDWNTLDASLRGYVEAWRRFRQETQFKPELIEHRGYNPTYGYAGTLDRLGAFPAGDKWIIDIKTGTMPWWVSIQLAAYAAFFEEPRSYRRMAVALKSDGTYQVQEFPGKQWQEEFNIFLAALTVMRAKQERSRTNG